MQTKCSNSDLHGMALLGSECQGETAVDPGADRVSLVVVSVDLFSTTNHFIQGYLLEKNVAFSQTDTI